MAKTMSPEKQDPGVYEVLVCIDGKTLTRLELKAKSFLEAQTKVATQVKIKVRKIRDN